MSNIESATSASPAKNMIGTYAVEVKRETAIRGQARPPLQPLDGIGAVLGVLGRLDAIEKAPADDGPPDGDDRSEQERGVGGIGVGDGAVPLPQPLLATGRAGITGMGNLDVAGCPCRGAALSRPTIACATSCPQSRCPSALLRSLGQPTPNTLLGQCATLFRPSLTGTGVQT
jgi:hypothetical protein